MCVEHIWLFRECRHSSRSKSYCEDTRRAQRQAESGCCGFFTSSPENVCEVRPVTHYDARPCRQCQRAAREAIDREARNLAKARAEAKQAARAYGWETAGAGAGRGGSEVHRDSHISSDLYRQAVHILPEREYMQYIPAPPGQPVASASRSGRSAASSSHPGRSAAPAGRSAAPAGRSAAPAGRSSRSVAPAGRSAAPAGRSAAPVGRSLTDRRARGATRGNAIPMVPLPPPAAVTRGQVRRGGGTANGSSHRTRRSPQERRQAQGEIRNDYDNIIRSAGLPLPLPRPRHEAADEFDEPLPDEEFLAMVSRAG